MLAKAEVTNPRPQPRLIELDILRGFLLVWMTLTHLPTKASLISNQTFGFVSGAEGFIFLSAFMVGQLEFRKELKSGWAATVNDIAKRTRRVYGYHVALLAIAFTVFAGIAVQYHCLALQNLLSFYLARPKAAVIAALLLEYRPSLLDILPMYVVFLAVTPLARRSARSKGWDPVIYTSFGLWAIAQFGLRSWLYHHLDLFGLAVPENSTGAFDIYAWQLLWIVGLAIGDIYADRAATEDRQPDLKAGRILSRPLTFLSVGLAAMFLFFRYSPTDRWINPESYGWLIDKWHLGPARVINFTAIAIVLVNFGRPIAALRILQNFALLGRASIEVFSVHILCCLAGDSLSPGADPSLPAWEQISLLLFTFCALYSTAYLVAKRRSAAAKKQKHILNA